MCKLLVLFQSFSCGIGLLTVIFLTDMFHVSFMHLDMIFEIIFVVELFSTLWAEMFVVCSLLVNIPQVFNQVFPEEKLLVADTA